MIAARVSRPAGLALSMIAIAVATTAVAITTDPNLGRCAESSWLGKQILTARAIPVVFGPESAAFSSASGSIGWLASVVAAVFARDTSGRVGCAALTIFSALICFAFVAARTARLAPPAFAVVAVAIVFASAVDALRIGGSTAIFLFGAAYMFALERPTRAGLAAIAVVAMVWCNADASGILAPILAFASAVGRSIEDRDFARARPFWIAFVVSLLAIFTTPSTTAYPAIALRSLRLAGSFGDAIPWTPASLAPLSYHIGFTALVFLMLALGIRARGAREGALAIVAIVIALANGNLLPIAAIVVAPTLAFAIADRFFTSVRWRATPRFASLALVSAIVALTIASSAIARGLTAANVENDLQPQQSLHVLALRGGIRRVACADLRWCDGAVVLGLHVLADDRIAAMPPSVRRAQATIAHVRRGWRIDVANFGIDAIVVARETPLATLLHASGWKRVSPSGSVAVFVRSGLRT